MKDRPFKDRTTYRHVVEVSQDRRQLVERAFEFVMREPLRLPVGCTMDDVGDATRTVLLRLIELSGGSSPEEVGDRDSRAWDRTVMALRKVSERSPHAPARTPSGLRRAVLREIRRILGERRGLSEDMSQETAEIGIDESVRLAERADVEAMLETPIMRAVRQRLVEAAKSLRHELQEQLTCKSMNRPIAREIIGYFFDRAEAAAAGSVLVSDHFRTALDDGDDAVVEALRAKGEGMRRLVRERGMDAVKRLIANMRDAVRDSLDEIRRHEIDLNDEYVLLEISDQIEEARRRREGLA